MTAYVTAALQNLLLLRLAFPKPLISPISPRILPAFRSRHEQVATTKQPMLLRSESFAEDLVDSYPFH